MANILVRWRVTCSWLAEAFPEEEKDNPGEEVDAGCDPGQKVCSGVGH